MTNKRVFLSLLLIACAAFIWSDKALASKHKHECESCDDHVVIIHAKCVKPEGIIIEKSGRYCLNNSVTWNPIVTGMCAITINASDVELDLNGYSFIQGNATANATGICLSAGVKNVVIKNGLIQNVNGFGILSKENTSLITLNNIRVKNCGLNGSVLNTVDNVSYTGGVAFLGLKFVNPVSASLCTDIFIKDCAFDTNTTSGGNIRATGLLMAGSDRVTIENSTFNGNIGPSTNTVAGAIFVRASNIKIDGSAFDENEVNVVVTGPSNAQGFNANAFGIFFTNGINSIPLSTDENFNIEITNCTFNSTVSSSRRAVGVRMARSQNIVIHDSQASKSFNPAANDNFYPNALNTAAGGFFISTCNNVEFKKCTSHSNLSNTFRVVAGFDIENCINVLVKDCYAVNQHNTGSGVGNGTTAGFYVEPVDNPVNQGVVFQDCVAENIIGLNTGNNLTSTGAGFVLFHADTCQIINCVSNKNTSFGIIVGRNDAPNVSVNCLIRDNEVYSNGRAGIVDVTASTAALANIYINNTGRNNPTNFVGLPTGTPIVTWNLTGGALPPANDKMSNMDIL